MLTENRFYFLATSFQINFFFIFVKEITYILPKLIHTLILFNIECLQKFSSNGQIWPAKKPYITRFLNLEKEISMKASKTKNRFSKPKYQY